ncbi:hypothetical protein WKV44_10550 [Spirochaetia bacterium 38H-sp]|uniref:TPM domain-containing protein n=1 Tax=Rarispira pelagica TaxID=3141764 RepID=A0ABU9UE80_9SPIR
MEVKKYILLSFIVFTNCYVPSQELVRDKYFIEAISEFKEVVRQFELIKNYIKNDDSGKISIKEKSITIIYGTDCVYISKTDEIRKIKRIEYYYVLNNEDNSTIVSIEKYLNEKDKTVFIIISYFDEFHGEQRLKLIWDSLINNYIIKTGEEAAKYDCTGCGDPCYGN